MEVHLYQQEVDFSIRPCRTFLSEFAPAYSLLWSEFWQEAFLKKIVPEIVLLPKEELQKANILCKSIYIIAWKYFAHLLVKLDACGQFEVGLRMDSPLMLFSSTPDLRNFCKAAMVCDEVVISPLSGKSYELFFTVRLF